MIETTGAALQAPDTTQSFIDSLRASRRYPLRARAVEILQMNITRRCNLCCRHCHVESSPLRTEEMSETNLRACLRAAAHPGITTIDITGGSPEMHPRLEWFLREVSGLGKRVLVRTNGVILIDAAYERFVDIYAQTGVEVVVSMPSLHRQRTNRIRGAGVFDRLLSALRRLNERGYGLAGSKLRLDLVHNPGGAFLPASQAVIESEFREVLGREHGVEFNQLFCIINCPVGRYLDFLRESGNVDDYFELLKHSFNADTIDSVMCRTTLSVACDGKLYDCDFNQALDIAVNLPAHATISDFDYSALSQRDIVVQAHCYACTAGAGSSCQGSVDG